MAFYTTTSPSSLTERLLARTSYVLDRAAKRLAHHRVYSETLAELRGLSDHDLNDLGLNRTMLKRLALEAADSKVTL